MKPPKLDRTLLNLGKDNDRMTSAEGARQHKTVDRLLAAFFGNGEDRREVQLLADEVGLGKTFVALAVAQTVLMALREKEPPGFANEFSRAYRAVVVVTPQGNHPLAAKWGDEVGALVKRCGLKPELLQSFKSMQCGTPEDLLIALRRASDLRRKPGSVPTVLICEAGMFTRKLRESGAKLRFMAASLFQWLGSKLPHEARWHVIRRAAEVRGYEDWAERVRRGEAAGLWDFNAHDRYLTLPVDNPLRDEFEEKRAFDAVPFRYSEMCQAFDKLSRIEDGEAALYSKDVVFGTEEEPKGIVPYCKWIAQKNGKAELYFDGFKLRVSALYKSLFPHLMGATLPLVIADEAHHWRRETEGCRSFLRYLAPFTHRLLLLTATPFQLCREELDGILSRSDAMAPTIGESRVNALRQKRDQILLAMQKSEEGGRFFSKLWGRLNDDLNAIRADILPLSPRVGSTADEFTQLVDDYWQVVTSQTGTNEQRVESLPGRVRPFFAAALALKKVNDQLGTVMRELIVRHRRDNAHRRYRVGREYPPVDGEVDRPDQYQLHCARGSVLPAEAELTQFLLMKVVASATRGRRKTALGMDVTGAYSTLWNSSEGRKAVAAATQNEASSYFPLLQKLTGGQGIPNRSDPLHPKVKKVVQTALDNWERDEKSLIFCFRLPTAIVLRDLISSEIEQRIGKARRTLLRGRSANSDEAALAQFKRSLTARTGSVLPAFMDRVLLGLAQMRGWPIFQIGPEDFPALAELAARCKVDGKSAIRDATKPDRVLLSRICEQILAQKYLDSIGDLDLDDKFILSHIADQAWIKTRYGLNERGESEGGLEEATDVLTRSSLSAKYEITDVINTMVYESLLQTFNRSHSRETFGLLESLVGGPNIFVPLAPFQIDQQASQRARHMTNQLWKITLQERFLRWADRGEVVDAVNRALLRDHFLLRLPAKVFAGGDEQWSEALVRGFHSAQLFGKQSEPVAAKIADYLDELAQMTPEERSHSLRYALNAQGKAVVLVSGSTRERDAVFRGFNSPLLPEILVCTQVGQEGIDLHRHCRHVVHYDLGWNPATIEQRTGRVDRIGSKTQRARKLALTEMTLPGLEVSLPYLAATYDERIFDRLYMRAQAFDLLMGGDPSADPDDEQDHQIEGVEEPEGAQFVALPESMRQELRVDLTAKL